MLRIVIFDDEERIGLQLKELLEQSGDDLVVDFFQDWHALQFYFSQHAHIDAVFMDICFQGSTSSGIDTEPQFSADGQSIYFTSDRSGGPQIYRMSVSGGEAKRVTFGGSYNISPRISSDGKTLAYISRRDGNFQLYALDLASGQELRLSDTANDESPSFSPNGKYIMYATESGRRKSLAVVSVDGRVKQRLTTQAGNIKEPTWGPFMK